jgi:hypothetical protein
MKKSSILLLTLLICTLHAFAQPTAVPYRVGNKFGVSDPSGKMLITPEFDILETVFFTEHYLVGYKLHENTVSSTLIYKNKVVLKDQPYKLYYWYNDLFVAHAYTLREGRGRWNNEPFIQTSQLFTPAGKKVLTTDFADISIINDFDKDNKLSEVLVYARDADGKISLLIYDKRTQQITKTIVDRTAYLRAPMHLNGDYNDKSITYVYKDSQGLGQQVKFEAGKGVIAVTSQGAADLRQIESRENGDGESGLFGGDELAMPYGDDHGSAAVEKVGARKVKIDLDFYYLPKKVEKIAVTNDGFESNYSRIVTKEGRKGLEQTDNQKMIVPARYDEVLEASFPASRHSGYILRNGTKFGLFIYGKPNPVIIEPVFDYMPLLDDMDYFQPNAPLIRLYDSNGQFFCYANGKGKLFYAAK